MYLAHVDEQPHTESPIIKTEPIYKESSFEELSRAAPCVFQQGFGISFNLFMENSAALYTMYALHAGIVMMSLGVFIWASLRKGLVRKSTFQYGSLGVGVVAFLSMAAFLFIQGERIGFGPVNSNHAHGDILVQVRDEKIDLSDPVYISSGEEELSNLAHIHDPTGSVVHSHAAGVTWGYALKTLGIEVQNSCLLLNKEKRKVCGEGDDRVYFFLNNRESTDALSTPINDLDKFTVYIGPKQLPENFLMTLQQTSNACVFSGKCLSRGRLDDGKGCSSK